MPSSGRHVVCISTADTKRVVSTGSRKCDCRLWVKGILEGKPFEQSLKTRSIERAEQLLANIQKHGRPEPPPEPKKEITITGALDAFIKDCEARNLNTNTLRKYRALSSRLTAFGKDRGITRCTDFTADTLRDFRGTWNFSPRTSQKELERVRAFFKLCVENEWLTKNPAKAIKSQQVDPSDVSPFPAKVQHHILDAAYRLPDLNPRTGTFIKLLLYSGLRITDAGQLSKSDIIDGRLVTRAKKNKATISIALPHRSAQRYQKP